LGQLPCFEHAHFVRVSTADTIFCMIVVVSSSKHVEFRGSSLDDLRSFPLSARREAGFQIDLVQRGEMPEDWKPMPTIGQGVQEIRIRDAAGAFRVVFVAKFADAIYVLHCFQKKTQRTSKPDLDLTESRYRDLLKELAR
jgi:phage-related protein